MSQRRTQLLLIISLILALVCALNDDHFAHKCTHDETERPKPEELEVDENFPPPKDEDGRVLQGTTYKNIRMYPYYGQLGSASATFQSYMKTYLIPPIIDYFQAALKIKYPIATTLKVSTSITSMCGYSVSSTHPLRVGVVADYFHYFDDAYDSSGNWVASSWACYIASGSKRPLVGITQINSALLKVPDGNVLLHEKNMVCVMHEMIHTLGFSIDLYAHYVDVNGNRLSGHYKTGTLGGKSSIILHVEPLKSKLRNFFNCPTLVGCYMENSGSSATAGSHFERRMLPFEFMTSGLIYDMQVTEFTLALLEGTGWYIPDYNYADPYWFGKGAGCKFIDTSCTSTGFNVQDFCTGSSMGCTNTGRGGGICKDDTRSDSCKFVHPSVNYDCENDAGDSYVRLPELQVYGRGAGSKCFTGTLSTSIGGSTSSFCFKYTCNGLGASTTLDVKVGSNTVTCTSQGSKTVSGYKGTINCPDPIKFCGTVAKKGCPRGCMGRGQCVNNACVCKTGFRGTDCALPA
jgi:hypothetical protein